MTAKGGNQEFTLRNPASRQLGCNFLDVEGNAAVFDLPAAGALRENCVTGTRIAVLRKPRRRDVDEQFTAPHARVWQVQMSESDHCRFFVTDETLERCIVRIRP